MRAIGGRARCPAAASGQVGRWVCTSSRGDGNAREVCATVAALVRDGILVNLLAREPGLPRVRATWPWLAAGAALGER